MASAELQTVIGMMRAADPMASGDLTKIREVMAAAPPARKPDDITWQTVDAGGVPAEWTIPGDAQPGRALVYSHGGGYATGSADLFRGLGQNLGPDRSRRSELSRTTAASRSGVKVEEIQEPATAAQHLADIDFVGPHARRLHSNPSNRPDRSDDSHDRPVDATM